MRIRCGRLGVEDAREMREHYALISPGLYCRQSGAMIEVCWHRRDRLSFRAALYVRLVSNLKIGGPHVTVEQNLKQLGIEIPEVAKPVAAYVPAVRAGEWVYISGQLPFRQGKLAKVGKVGTDVTLEEAYQEARQCAVNCIAAIKSIVDDLDRVKIVKVTGFVASAAGFNDQPKVMNGASDLFARVFGDAGIHARAAVGVAELPLNACCEVELVALVQ
jgi:enamine deaminase RidA (YjgF/YER057c/UK114 family)